MRSDAVIYCLHGKCYGIPIQALQYVKERLEGWAVILLMRTKDTGEVFGAVKGDPRKLPAVVVQKARRQADAPPGGHVGQRGIMVGAVEVTDLPGADQAVLNGFQRLRRSAAHHQRPAVKVFFSDQILFSQALLDSAKREHAKAADELATLRAEVVKSIRGESSFSAETLGSLLKEAEGRCAALEHAGQDLSCGSFRSDLPADERHRQAAVVDEHLPVPVRRNAALYDQQFLVNALRPE